MSPSTRSTTRLPGALHTSTWQRSTLCPLSYAAFCLTSLIAPRQTDTSSASLSGTTSTCKHTPPFTPQSPPTGALCYCLYSSYFSHVDFLHQPDFEKIYESFWRVNSQQSCIDDFDLRYMALILVVLAFGVLLDHPSPASTVPTSALRRVAANDPRARQELEQLLSASRALGGTLGDRIELSLKWSWAAKRALVEASGFYGDSMETVGALGLVSDAPGMARIIKM